MLAAMLHSCHKTRIAWCNACCCRMEGHGQMGHSGFRYSGVCPPNQQSRLHSTRLLLHAAPVPGAWVMSTGCLGRRQPLQQSAAIGGFRCQCAYLASSSPATTTSTEASDSTAQSWLASSSSQCRRRRATCSCCGMYMLAGPLQGLGGCMESGGCGSMRPSGTRQHACQLVNT